MHFPCLAQTRRVRVIIEAHPFFHAAPDGGESPPRHV